MRFDSYVAVFSLYHYIMVYLDMGVFFANTGRGAAYTVSFLLKLTPPNGGFYFVSVMTISLDRGHRGTFY